MENKTIIYSCTYDKENNVFKVCRKDGEDLENFMPDELVREIAIRTAYKTNEIIAVWNFQDAKYFSKDGKNGFIDIKCRKFSQNAIEEILNTSLVSSEEKPIDKISEHVDGKTNSMGTSFRKFLSIFKKKH